MAPAPLSAMAARHRPRPGVHPPSSRPLCRVGSTDQELRAASLHPRQGHADGRGNAGRRRRPQRRLGPIPRRLPPLGGRGSGRQMKPRCTAGSAPLACCGPWSATSANGGRPCESARRSFAFMCNGEGGLQQSLCCGSRGRSRASGVPGKPRPRAVQASVPIPGWTPGKRWWEPGTRPPQ